MTTVYMCRICGKSKKHDFEQIKAWGVCTMCDKGIQSKVIPPPLGRHARRSIKYTNEIAKGKNV